MPSYTRKLIFIALSMIMVGCSSRPTIIGPSRKARPITVIKHSDKFINCVLGFIKVGVEPTESGKLCEKALNCNKIKGD